MKPHYLFIETAQSHFVDSVGKLFSFADKFRQDDAKKAGLSPIILVALWVPVYGFFYVKAIEKQDEIELKAFILEAWSKNPLKMPQSLIVSELIANAFPGIAQLCKTADVSLEVVPKGNKAYVANRRGLEAAFEGLHVRGRSKLKKTYFGDETYQPWSLADLSKVIAWRRKWWPVAPDIFDIFGVPENEGDKDKLNPVLISSKNWDHITARSVLPSELLIRDEKKIPVRSKAWIQEEMNARIAGRYRSDQPLVADDMYDEDDEFKPEVTQRQCKQAENLTFDGANDIKELLPGWPVSKAKIARNVGLETPEIDWFLTMKKGLRHDDARRLRFEFGLVATDYVGEFKVDMGLVLRFAKERNGAVNAYDRLSHGGDVEKAFELIPKNGVLNPKWQAIYLMACGDLTGNLLFFERGSKAAVAVTNKKMLINRSDEHQEFKVSNKMYADAMLIADQTINSCAEMGNAINRFYGNNRAEIEKSFDQFPGW